MVVASSSMQGWRVSMEDAHQHILELSPDDPTASFFGVYDGKADQPVSLFTVFRSRSRWNGHFLVEPEPKFLGLAPAPGIKIHIKCYKKS
jgi:Protein phosphatase 2C